MRGGGGDEWMNEVWAAKEWTGRSASSSSDNSGEGGSSGTVEPSEMNDSFETCNEVPKLPCLVLSRGEDCGR